VFTAVQKTRVFLTPIRLYPKAIRGSDGYLLIDEIREGAQQNSYQSRLSEKREVIAQWLFLVEDRIPSRQKRILGLGKQIQTLGDRTPEDLEKVSRKLAAQEA